MSVTMVVVGEVVVDSCLLSVRTLPLLAPSSATAGMVGREISILVGAAGVRVDQFSSEPRPPHWALVLFLLVREVPAWVAGQEGQVA